MRPNSCMMKVRCTCCAPITGYNQSTQSCSIHRPDAMLQGKVKESDPAVAWPALQHIWPPGNGSLQLLAPALVTGLGVLVVPIPCKYGFRPTGPQSFSTSYNIRRIAIVLKTHLGWTRRRLRLVFSSNGRRQGLTDGCSSRSATIEMEIGKVTFAC